METRRFSARLNSLKAAEMFKAAVEMGFDAYTRYGIAPNGRAYTAIIVEDVTEDEFRALSDKRNEIEYNNLKTLAQ